MSKVLNGKAIRVEEFDMEYGYDISYANGKAFRGTKGQDLDPSLSGMVAGEEGIKFQSDFSRRRQASSSVGMTSEPPRVLCTRAHPEAQEASGLLRRQVQCPCFGIHVSLQLMDHAVEIPPTSRLTEHEAS